jgi:hypothetical protein
MIRWRPPIIIRMSDSWFINSVSEGSAWVPDSPNESLSSPAAPPKIFCYVYDLLKLIEGLLVLIVLSLFVSLLKMVTDWFFFFNEVENYVISTLRSN